MSLSMTTEPNILAKPMPKERKKHDRFNGMSEEEVSKRTLPDHLANNLDIIIVSVIFQFLLLFFLCIRKKFVGYFESNIVDSILICATNIYAKLN